MAGTLLKKPGKSTKKVLTFGPEFVLKMSGKMLDNFRTFPGHFQTSLTHSDHCMPSRPIDTGAHT